MAEQQQHQHAGKGIAFACAAFFLLTCMDGIAKLLGGTYPIVMLVFFRALFGMIPIIPLVVRGGGLKALKTKRPWLHALRGLCVLLAITSYFIGLQHMPIAETLTIAFASPLFMTILSIPILGEKVGLHRWGAVLVGFVGVIIITQPGSDAFRVEALWPLLSGATFATASVLTGLLARTENNAAITFYSTVSQGLPALILLPWFWQAPEIATDWLWFITMGILGGVGLQLLTSGFRAAPASVIAPFEYTALIWATAIGWFGWQEWPGDRVWLGAAILIASGSYITYREALAKRRQLAAATPLTSGASNP